LGGLIVPKSIPSYQHPTGPARMRSGRQVQLNAKMRMIRRRERGFFGRSERVCFMMMMIEERSLIIIIILLLIREDLTSIF
jgi:hypothetical protein